MEVGRLIDVRQKLAESLEEISLYFEKKKKKHATGEAFLVHNRSSPSISACIFLHLILEMQQNYEYIKHLTAA